VNASARKSASPAIVIASRVASTDPDLASPATMPSRIQPARSSAIAAAISTCAMLRRIRSRSERIFAITGSAEMPSAVPMNSANTSRSVDPPTNASGSARPRATPASTGSTRLPTATRAVARPRLRISAGSVSSPVRISRRNTPIQDGPASSARWSGSSGNSQ
jgi:hypothetical protein